MLDWLKEATIPFILTAQQAQPRLSLPRLIEAAIIAGVTMFGTVQAMGAKLDAIKEKLDKVEKSADESRRVQLEIVPMRNLQIQNLQDTVKAHEARLQFIEKRR